MGIVEMGEVRRDEALAHMYRALTAKEKGDLPTARRFWTQALDLFTALGANIEMRQVKELLAEHQDA